MVQKFVTSMIAMALLMAMSVSTAGAQEPVTKQELAESDLATLVQMAREAYEAGEYDVAIERLLLANRKEPDPRLLLNVARSYAQAGECAMSLVYYAAFIRHPAAQEELVASAQAALDEGKPECDAYSEELGGRIMFESEPLFARVYIDDEFLGTTPTETAGMAPGTYQVRVELDGYTDFTREIEVSAQQDATVGALLEEPPAEEEVVEAPEITEPEDVDEVAAPVNYIAYGLMGAGALALVNGLVFDLVLIPSIDEERNSLDDSQTEEYAELTEQRQGRANVAVGSYVAGGVLLAGGGAWLLYDYMTQNSADSSSDDEELRRRMGLRIAPLIGKASAGLVLGGRF